VSASSDGCTCAGDCFGGHAMYFVMGPSRLVSSGCNWTACFSVLVVSMAVLCCLHPHRAATEKRPQGHHQHFVLAPSVEQ
jgi:hypothetical protein